MLWEILARIFPFLYNFARLASWVLAMFLSMGAVRLLEATGLIKRSDDSGSFFIWWIALWVVFYYTFKFVGPPLARALWFRRGHVRGTKRASYKKVKRMAQKRLANGLYPWGGLSIPRSLATKHFLAVGRPGSGKTVSLDYVLQAVLREKRRPGVVVYDVKTEYPAKLRTFLGPAQSRLTEDDIVRLNPFDTRCRAWLPARDFQNPQEILAAASLLFPKDENERHQFFERAAIDLVTGVLTSFWLKWPEEELGRPWYLSDLLNALSRPEYLRAILHWAPDANRDAMNHFAEERLLSDIKATLTSKSGPYRIIAAYWDRVLGGREEGRAHDESRAFSANEWVSAAQSEGGNAPVVVLAHSHTSPDALKSINSAIFKLLAARLLDGPNGFEENPRAWFFFDELGTAGNLPVFPEVIAKGRDKGICVAAGIQDVGKLVGTYGRHGLDGIVGHMGHKAFFKLPQETAEWASRVLGNAEQWEYSYNESLSKFEMSRSSSKQVKPIVMASELQAIAAKSNENELRGFYLTHGIDEAYDYAMKIRDVARAFPLGDEGERGRLNLEPWPAPNTPEERAAMYLRWWTDEELRKLQLDGVEPMMSGPATTPEQQAQIIDSGLDYKYSSALDDEDNDFDEGELWKPFTET